MTDNNKKQTPVTLEMVMGLLTVVRDESRAQNMDLILRLENVLTRHGAVTGAKKGVVNKPKGVKGKDKNKVKEIPTHFSNTMYWWTAMYAVQSPLIKNYFSPEEVKKAEEVTAETKNKTEGHEYRRVIGLTMWRKFTKSKKGELKTMFENWKKANAKNLAKDVETEKHTDDDSEEKETGLGNVNDGEVNKEDDDE
jgi:hypothetical protein